MHKKIKDHAIPFNMIQSRMIKSDAEGWNTVQRDEIFDATQSIVTSSGIKYNIRLFKESSGTVPEQQKAGLSV